MRSSVGKLSSLLSAAQRHAGAEVGAAASGTRSYQSLGAFSFASSQDAPTSSLSTAIKVTAATSGKTVQASVSAGGASARAKYTVANVRQLGASPIVLKDVARVSVLHSSIVDFLLKLTAERYAVLAQWPDFTALYGKDYYYRAHPDDLKAFYAAADAFHASYDALTEFESLSALGAELLPGYTKRRQNIFGPATGPTTANAAVTQFLLGHAQ